MSRLSYTSVGLVALALAASTAWGQSEITRSKRWEVFATGNWSYGGDTGLRSQSLPSAVDFKSFYGMGLGVGYNLSDNFNVNVNGAFGTVENKATRNGAVLRGEANEMKWDIGLDYNLLKSRFTPVIGAVIAIDYFSDDETIGGQRFSYQQSTFGLGGGAGFRWDISSHVFAKAMYRYTYNMGLDKFEDDMSVHSVTVTFGYTF